MYTVGKFLQALGLVIPLVGLAYGLKVGTARGVLTTELALLAGGALLFVVGTKIVQKAS